MIPTRYDYYKARSREHSRLAARAGADEERDMHRKLVSAYNDLARKYRLKQTVSLRAA